jgi:hypothetical protein
MQAALLQWDTGAGFNDYEAKPIRLLSEAALPAGAHRLTVSSNGRKDPRSQGAEVWISAVKVFKDGAWRTLNWSEIQFTGNYVERGDARVLLTAGGAASFVGDYSGASVRVGKHPYSGYVTVQIDGIFRREENLYSPASDGVDIVAEKVLVPGTYSSEFLLPARKVLGLKVTCRQCGDSWLRNVEIVDMFGRLLWRQSVIQAAPVLEFRSLQIDNAKFSWIMLALKVAAAFIVGSLLYFAIVCCQSLITNEDRRRYFLDQAGYRRMLILFAILIAVYSFWILGQWPAFPTNDTLDQLNQVISSRFDNINPFTHTLMLGALYQLDDGLGLVSIIQALLMAALASWTFSYLISAGANPKITYACFALFLVSPVVAIYNLEPWRDIVFSWLVVFWVVFIYVNLVEKARTGVQVEPSRTQYAGMALLLVLVCTVRHNGIVFLIVMPAVMFIARVWRRPVVLRFAALSLAGVALVNYALAGILRVHENTNYGFTQLTVIINPLVGILKNPDYKPDDPAAERAVLDKMWNIDELFKAYDPASALGALGATRRASLTGPEFQAIKQLFIKTVFHHPILFLDERSRMFARPLGFGSWGWMSNLHEPDRPNRLMPAEHFESLFHIHYQPIVGAFSRLQAPILRSVSQSRGFPQELFIYFTAFVPLVLLILVCVLFRWFAITAIASTVILLQLITLFFTVLSSDFRYVYFLYLYGFIVVPMLLAERRVKSSEM